MKRGFKASAERIAAEVRSELGLKGDGQLDVWKLAQHLAIPVWTLGDVARLAPGNSFVRYFTVIDPDAFSAVTVFCGYKRYIIHNENNHPNRQVSDLAHEISHILLEHRPAPVADRDGRRCWDAELEEEASWLGAAVLVPREGALAMCKSRCTAAQIALHFGVSELLCQWRIRQSGIDRQAERWQRYR